MNIVLEREPFHVLLPLLHLMVPLNVGNCHLTMPVIKGRCACNALSNKLNIGEFKSIKNNFITIKHIQNESVNIIEGCNVAFDTNDCWNFP